MDIIDGLYLKMVAKIYDKVWTIEKIVTIDGKRMQVVFVDYGGNKFFKGRVEINENVDNIKYYF